tara:strand:+ start:43 stop:639 length:597 start_codon:yes stop_codon:yes gene_type:complete
MSTLKTTSITHGSNSGTANLTLASDGGVSIAQNKLSCPGTIIQVAQCIKNDTWYEGSVAEGGFSAVVTGLTQSFTCSSASNKVLITGQIFAHNNIAGGWGAGLALTADGSIINASTGNARGSRSRLTAVADTYYLGTTIPINYLHSPSSTSAITYGVKVWNGHTSAQTVTINYASAQDGDTNNAASMVSTLTFMEIAG